jgi:hypothetical protein
MELIVKLYADKPSRIGVKYPKEYQAVKAYEEIISKYRNENFTLRIELAKGKAFLLLVSGQTGGRVVYKELDYKTEHLKKLEVYMQSGGNLQFVHIYADSNRLLIARPFRQQIFITVSSVEIINPVYTGNVI